MLSAFTEVFMHEQAWSIWESVGLSRSARLDLSSLFTPWTMTLFFYTPVFTINSDSSLGFLSESKTLITTHIATAADASSPPKMLYKLDIFIITQRYSRNILINSNWIRRSTHAIVNMYLPTPSLFIRCKSSYNLLTVA